MKANYYFKVDVEAPAIQWLLPLSNLNVASFISHPFISHVECIAEIDSFCSAIDETANDHPEWKWAKILNPLHIEDLEELEGVDTSMWEENMSMKIFLANAAALENKIVDATITITIYVSASDETVLH